MPRKRMFLDIDCVDAARKRLEHVYDTFDTIAFRKSDIFNHKKIVTYYDNFIKQKTNTSFLIFLILTSISFLKVFNSK